MKQDEQWTTVSIFCKRLELYKLINFIIHWGDMGFPKMVFMLDASGLHICNPNDQQGIARFCFLEMVKDNKSMFTNRQIESADKGCNLHAGLAFPSMPDYKWMLQANLLWDCPVAVQDLSVALKIWGPSVA